MSLPEIASPPSRANRLLVIEDIPKTLGGSLKLLEELGWEIEVVGTVISAEKRLAEEPFGFVLVDWGIPAREGEPVDREGGAKVLRSLKAGELGTTNQDVDFLVVAAAGRAIDDVELACWTGFMGTSRKLGDLYRLRAVARTVLAKNLRGRWSLAERRDRVLVRVVRIDGDSVLLVVPGWNPGVRFEVARRTLAGALDGPLRNRRPPLWLVAGGHLAAASPEHLGLSGFVPAPSPVPEDELE